MDRNGILEELKRVVKLEYEDGATIAEIQTLGLSDFNLDADQRKWVIRFQNGVRNRLKQYWLKLRDDEIKTTVKTRLISYVQGITEDPSITMAYARNLVQEAIQELIEGVDNG